MKTMRPTIDDELAQKVRQAALDRGVDYREFLAAAANLRREAS